MTAISSIVNNIFRDYDRNGDGAISTRRGLGFEGSHNERQMVPGHNYDEILVLRYTHDKLFKAADKNDDGFVSRRELTDAIKFFDTNNDGELKNSGPFWNRKGEYKNFEKAYPERSEVIERHLIPKPVQPPHIPYPNHPNYPKPHHGRDPFGHDPFGRDPFDRDPFGRDPFKRPAHGVTVGVRIG